MSEKRFNCVLGKDYHIINDNFDNMTYFLQERNDVVKLVEVLNEQQDTIRKLQDLCGESDSENAKLRIENKRLEEENRELRQSVEYWQKKYEEGTETFQIN